MQLRLLVFLLTLISFASTALSQDCCTADIVKLEKKLSRKYESYKRILSLPKDGEVSSMSEVFYHVQKKGKHAIINGNRSLIFNTKWEDIELLPKTKANSKYTFFSYSIDGKKGIGSVEFGLHLLPGYQDVKLEVINDSNTICLIGLNSGQTKIRWVDQDKHNWISKELPFALERINVYRRASSIRYGKYHDMVFLNGAKEASSFELKSGQVGISGPIGYTNTVIVDNIEAPALLCKNYKTGDFQLMSPSPQGKLAILFHYNEAISSGHTIKGGLIIGKTDEGHYKLPLGEHPEEFQADSYDQVYYSDQNEFLIKGNQVVIVNRQGSRQIRIKDYFEPDACGNYHPEVHLTSGDTSFFGHPIRPLQGSIFLTQDGQLLNDSLNLMSSLDNKRCLYLFWEDEHREGIMGKSAPKNKRGVMDGNGNVLLPPEYSAIWKKGKYFLAMRGGKVSSMVLTPTLYEDGEWILYDENFEHIGSSVTGAKFRQGGVIEKNGFTFDEKEYTIYEFTKKFFGVGVYEP